MARKPSAVKGLYERPRGSGRWYVRYYQNGIEVKKSFGRDRAGASDYLDKVRLLKRTGTGIVPTSAKRPAQTYTEMTASQGEVLLDELCDGFLQHVKNDLINYTDQYNPPIRIARIKKAFGHRLAASIKPYEISDWLVSLKTPAGKPLAAGTRNRYKGVFSGIFKWGKDREKVPSNPVRDFKSIREGEGVIRWLDDEEEAKLRKIMEEDVALHDPIKQPILRKRALHRIYEFDIALGTGVRRSEEYRLCWPDINYTRREITLNRTKYGPGRVVHMIADVEHALREIQKIPLTRRSRSKAKPNNAPLNSVFALGDNKKWFQSVVKRAGIKKFRWHDLRHTFISRLVQKGYNLKVVQIAAGHRTIQMTARYAHLAKGDVTNAMDSLNRPKEATRPVFIDQPKRKTEAA